GRAPGRRSARSGPRGRGWWSWLLLGPWSVREGCGEVGGRPRPPGSVAADDEHAAHGGDLRTALVGEVHAGGDHGVAAGGADRLDREGGHQPVPRHHGTVQGEGLLAVDHAGEVDPGGGILDVLRLRGLSEGDQEGGRGEDPRMTGTAG